MDTLKLPLLHRCFAIAGGRNSLPAVILLSFSSHREVMLLNICI